MFIDRHHIVPRHEGGDDSKENIVLLPRNLHQEVHYRRWLVYGKLADLYAFGLLGGKLSKEEQTKIFEDQRSRYFRDKDKIEQARKTSDKWKSSVTSEEFRSKQRKLSKRLNKEGKINSPESRRKISEVKSTRPNYNSKSIFVYGKIWTDVNKCIKSGEYPELTARKLRYRAESKHHPDVYYIS